jgi:hypothetical protein
MKFTSNLYFLLCMFGTIAMPVVEASLNGLELKRSSAATKKRAAKNQKAFEVAMHQQRRGRQFGVAPAFCKEVYGPNSPCTCSNEGDESQECLDFTAENCLICDILNPESCLIIDEEAIDAAVLPGPEEDTWGDAFEIDCTTYKSGPFADNTICSIENRDKGTCTFTINETECNSCTVVDIEFTCYHKFDIDCSNIIAGETWSLCNDDIPDTSLFTSLGLNGFVFSVLTCSTANDVKESGSGGVAASSTHVLSLFGLVIVASFL